MHFCCCSISPHPKSKPHQCPKAPQSEGTPVLTWQHRWWRSRRHSIWAVLWGSKVLVCFFVCASVCTRYDYTWFLSFETPCSAHDQVPRLLHAPRICIWGSKSHSCLYRRRLVQGFIPGSMTSQKLGFCEVAGVKARLGPGRMPCIQIVPCTCLARGRERDLARTCFPASTYLAARS